VRPPKWLCGILFGHSPDGRAVAKGKDGHWRLYRLCHRCLLLRVDVADGAEGVTL